MQYTLKQYKQVNGDHCPILIDKALIKLFIVKIESEQDDELWD